MLVQKLFSTEKKAFTEKYPYQKPVYKTYRELLELDKPKQQVFVESDDQNDDFLEKLLKKEKDKKIKNKIKRKESKAKIQKKDMREDKLVKSQSKLLKLMSQENKKSLTINKRQGSSKKLGEVNQQELLGQKRKEVIVYKRSSSTNKINKKDENIILVDEGRPIFMVAPHNALIKTSLNSKSQGAYAELLHKRSQQKCRNDSIKQITTQLKAISSKANIIEHQIMLEGKFKMFKARDNDKFRWAFITNNPQTQYKSHSSRLVDRSGKLFQTAHQEEAFLQSLKSIPHKL